MRVLYQSPRAVQVELSRDELHLIRTAITRSLRAQEDLRRNLNRLERLRSVPPAVGSGVGPMAENLDGALTRLRGTREEEEKAWRGIYWRGKPWPFR